MEYYKSKEIQLFQGDCLALLPSIAADLRFDMVFADPPYNLSNGGVTCHAGRMVSVNKGEWDRSSGVEADHEFILAWLSACRSVMKPNATIWVTGTRHVIFSVGYAMQELGFKLLNEITWFKPNASPNLSCRYFTHSHETVLWAARDEKSRHYFDYELMKRTAGGKQMRSVWPDIGNDDSPQDVWVLNTPGKDEKRYGKHPTQKPVALLERIVLASTGPGDLILDPFSGSGTTGVAAVKHGRRYVGIEPDEEFLSLSAKRLQDAVNRSFQRHLIPT